MSTDQHLYNIVSVFSFSNSTKYPPIFEYRSLTATGTQKKVFFIGDLAWRRSAITEGKQKFWPASLLVDRNRQQTLETILKVRKVAEENPTLIVVPAHDASAQLPFGNYPSWVKSL